MEIFHFLNHEQILQKNGSNRFKSSLRLFFVTVCVKLFLKAHKIFQLKIYASEHPKEMRFSQNLLEDSVVLLLKLEFDVDKSKDIKKKKQITQKRTNFIHNLSKNNLIRWLEYEHKLDRFLEKKDGTLNKFLNDLYQYILRKHDDETIFTMYTNWLLEIVQRKENFQIANNPNNSDDQIGIIEIEEIEEKENIEAVNNGKNEPEGLVFTQKKKKTRKSFPFTAERHISRFLMDHIKRNKSLYKMLLVSKKLYEIQQLQSARRLMLDAVRFTKNRENQTLIIETLEMFKQCENDHGDGCLDQIIDGEIEENKINTPKIAENV